MKEKTIPKKVKGTVLFTVVCVMMVMIVFLMGTLALAATASTRAQNTYSTAQTQSTARAGVTAIMSAMQNNKVIATAAAKVSPTVPTLSVNDVNIEYVYEDADGNRSTASNSAVGKITDASIEYVGKKTIVNADGDLAEKTIIKISATAQQGTASSTYAAYVLRDAEPDNDEDGENQGFVATGSATSGNHTSVYGGAYIGFNDAFRDPTYVPATLPYTEYKFTNAWSTYETDMQVNGTLNNDSGSGIELVIKAPGSGLTVWGDITLNRPIKTYIAGTEERWAFSSANPLDYTKIPFIYAEGKVAVGGTTNYIGDANIPLNIYCDSFSSNRDDVEIYADIYCMGTGESVFSGNANGNKGLLKWTKYVLEYGSTGGVLHDAGSVYSKGSIRVGPGNNAYVFDGDVVCEGDFTIERNVKINGNLKVGGVINTNGHEVQMSAGKICACDTIDNAGNIKNATVQQLRTGIDTSRTIPATVTVKAGYTPIEKSYQVLRDFVGPNPYYSGNPWESATITYKIVIADADGNMTDKYDQYNDQNWVVEADGIYNSHPEWGLHERIYDATYSYYERDTDHAVVSEAEATELHAAQYFDASGNPIATPAIYPPEYEKSVILGRTNPDGTPATTQDYKIIKTVDEILTSASDPYKTIYAVPSGTSHETDCNTKILNLGSSGSLTDYWTKVGNPGVFTVVKSCTITGNASDGRKVIVKAPADGSEIWIVLDNLSLSGGCFVIDDSVSSGTVNILVKGICSFSSTPDIGGITMANGDSFPAGTFGYLGVYSIAKQFTDASKPHQIYTSSSLALKNADGSLKYERIGQPCVNIYSERESGGTYPSLTVSNNSCMTAFMKAPYLDFTQASTGAGNPASTLYYNGFDISNASTTEIGCIGCLICHKFDAGNNWELLYAGAGDTASDPPIFDDALMTSWQVLYYENY